MIELALAFELPGEPAAALEALANALVLRCWYGAPPGYFRVGVSGAFAPGQAMTMVLRNGRGECLTHTVAVRELGPRTVLASSWDGGPLAGSEVVAHLTLEPGTRAVLTHEGLASPAQADAYAAFWRACFERLHRLLAGQVVSPWEELSNEIQAFFDPLGVAAYGVLAGLREAGAPPEAIARVEDTLYGYLPALDADTGAMLDAVMRARLAVIDGWRP